jgi:peptidase A4-like protein
MNTRFLPWRAAGVTCAIALAAIAPSATKSTIDPPLIVHGPIQPHRNDDGSLARGKRNEIDTSNWSGYAVAKFETGQTYLGANATWAVPTVIFKPDAAGSTVEYSSTWVGIGGFCENALCTRADRSLIQLGTEQDISSTGATQYYAWYEMLPQYPVRIPIEVKPGDSITASLQCTASGSNLTLGALV